MTQAIPTYISITFIATVLVSLIFLYRILVLSSLTANKKIFVIIAILLWLAFQGILSYNLFYLDTVGNLPPPFTLLGFIPSFIFMAILFLTINGRVFIDSLPLFELSLLSVIRIPVEVVLYWLFVQQLIPEAMTFSGFNFDILAGITAPIIAYLGFVKSTISHRTVLLWNVVSLILLVIIILLSVFSFPSVIQQYAFDQPNIGMLYFPFFWLPSFIVPFVFFSHLVMIRRISRCY